MQKSTFNPVKFREEIAKLNAKRTSMRAHVTEAIVDLLADNPQHVYELNQPVAGLHEGDTVNGYRFKDGKIWEHISRKTDWIIQLGDKGWYHASPKLSDLTTIYERIYNRQ